MQVSNHLGFYLSTNGIILTFVDHVDSQTLIKLAILSYNRCVLPVKYYDTSVHGPNVGWVAAVYRQQAFPPTHSSERSVDVSL